MDADKKKLEEFRVQIDDVDRRILTLLNERTRIVQQIGQHLSQADRIGLQVNRLLRKLDDQLVIGGLNQRPRRLQGGLDDLGQLDALFAQLGLTAGNARNVEQVFAQAADLLDVPAHDGLKCFRFRGTTLSRRNNCSALLMAANGLRIS